MVAISVARTEGLSDFVPISDATRDLTENSLFVRTALRVLEVDSEWFFPISGFVTNLWIRSRTVVLLPLPYPPTVAVRTKDH